jgi:hypothetical protein
LVAGPTAERQEEIDMTSWSELAAAAPDLAAQGLRLFRRGEVDEALLATVRGDDPPRIHPIWIKVVGGELYAFITASAKRTDLERDGRYALHTHQDPVVPNEFSVRGRARLVEGDARDRIAAEWYFQAGDEYHLFAFGIEAALLGVRKDADEWPPRYTSWTAPAQSSLTAGR